MVRTGRTSLGRELERAARLCTETLAKLAERYPEIGRTPVARELLLAVAAMETAEQHLDVDGTVRQSSLLITVTLSRQAAAAARRHGGDDDLLRLAAACEGVAALCEAALAGESA